MIRPDSLARLQRLVFLGLREGNQPKLKLTRYRQARPPSTHATGGPTDSGYLDRRRSSPESTNKNREPVPAYPGTPALTPASADLGATVLATLYCGLVQNGNSTRSLSISHRPHGSPPDRQEPAADAYPYSKLRIARISPRPPPEQHYHVPSVPPVPALSASEPALSQADSRTGRREGPVNTPL